MSNHASLLTKKYRGCGLTLTWALCVLNRAGAVAGHRPGPPRAPIREMVCSKAALTQGGRDRGVQNKDYKIKISFIDRSNGATLACALRRLASHPPVAAAGEPCQSYSVWSAPSAASNGASGAASMPPACRRQHAAKQTECRLRRAESPGQAKRRGAAHRGASITDGCGSGCCESIAASSAWSTASQSIPSSSNPHACCGFGGACETP